MIETSSHTIARNTMGFEHWIMQNFWTVIIISLVLLVAGHFAVVWLMSKGAPKTHTDDTP